MVRPFAAALALAVVALAPGGAQAQAELTPWTAPDGLFTVGKPADWPAPEAMGRGGGAREFVMGAADYECWFAAFERAETAAASVASVIRSYTPKLSNDQWLSIANGHPLFDGAPSVKSTAVEATAGAFPVQTAVIGSPEAGDVVSAITGRPGKEIWTFCASYDGQDRGALFRQIAASVGTPRDAEWLASLPPPAPAAPTPAPAP